MTGMTNYTPFAVQRLRDAFRSLIGNEATVVVENGLGEADWRTAIVPVEWDEYGIGWRIPRIEFDILGMPPTTWVRWTVYNDRWEPVFEDELNVTTSPRDTTLVVHGISANLAIPTLSQAGRMQSQNRDAEPNG